MNKAPILLAAGCLMLMAAVGRASDDTTFPAYENLSIQSNQKPAPATLETAPAIDVEKSVAAQALQAQGTQPQTTVTPVEVPSTQAIVAGPEAPTCCTGTPQRSCWAHFCAWLTYQPLCRTGACGCCQGTYPCCNPPLYAYFPCTGCNRGQAGCGDHGCANGACGSPTLAEEHWPRLLGSLVHHVVGQ